MTCLGHRELARGIAHQPVVVLPDEDGAEQGHSDRPTEPAEEVRRGGDGAQIASVHRVLDGKHQDLGDEPEADPQQGCSATAVGRRDQAKLPADSVRCLWSGGSHSRRFMPPDGAGALRATPSAGSARRGQPPRGAPRLGSSGMKAGGIIRSRTSRVRGEAGRRHRGLFAV